MFGSTTPIASSSGQRMSDWRAPTSRLISFELCLYRPRTDEEERFAGADCPLSIRRLSHGRQQMHLERPRQAHRKGRHAGEWHVGSTSNKCHAESKSLVGRCLTWVGLAVLSRTASVGCRWHRRDLSRVRIKVKACPSTLPPTFAVLEQCLPRPAHEDCTLAMTTCWT
ncbi:hypothetical protein MRB53_039540 [Persea americana]|nr:hypothetical protein MRB53_039540 [Persea americana]